MSSSDQNNSRDSPTSPHSNQRRSSFVDMFNSRASVSSQNQPPRRLSITTLGLSTLPQAQSSPFSAMRTRAESISSANSTSVDESPFEDEASSSSLSTSVPATPFARRMSFGAQQRAMRGSVGGVNLNNNGNANGRAPISSAGIVHKASASSQTSKSREGYDFAEKLRARAERSSISNGYLAQVNPSPPTSQPHQRSKSVAIMEPLKAETPKQQRPDAFQERILKGDFYMD